MSTDAKARKIEELRVVDLRVELEKRGLDKAGIKAVLIERLKKALEDDGHNPDEYEFEASFVGGGGTPKQSRKSVDRDAEEDLANHVNGDSSVKEDYDEEDQEEAQEQEDAQETNEKSESTEENGDGKGESEDKADGEEVTEEKSEWSSAKEEGSEFLKPESEQAEASEEEVGCGDEEDTRNMEDDSINLMLEDEEKMLEDELTFNEPDRHEQEDSQRGKERSRTKEGSPATHAGADSTSSGKKDKDLASESQDKKECNKPKSSGDEKGKDDKPKDDRDHKTKGSSSSNSSLRNLWVSGLASSTRAQDLKSVFSKYGKVTSAKIVTNAKTPGAKCYGFVTMMSSEDANKCISQLNHTELHGRMIQVEKAKGEPGGPSRNKVSSTRKPSDSKKDSGSDKKKEGEKSDGDKKDAGSDKKEGQDDKAGKEGEKKDERRSHSRDASRSSKEHDRRPSRNSRSFERRPEHRTDSYKMGHQRSGRHEIMEERERQRLRARERIMREEERRRREDEVRQRNIERRQREEAERLQREREKLRMEREKIERQKHELLRLEREHQRMEREKLEREREELRRQQMSSNQRRYEETRRSIKRPAEDRDRREFFDDRSKRPAPDNRSRFESSSAPQRRNYDRSEPTRFDHNHGNHGTHGSHGSHSSSGGRDDMRPPGGVGGGSRYEDRREIRERDDRRPVDRSGPRDDRDHRGPMPSQTSRDRPRDRPSLPGWDEHRTHAALNQAVTTNPEVEMYRTAVVGHGQVPPRIVVDDNVIEIKVFRARAAQARNFHRDARLRAVLRQKYDLVILWLGGNDIKEKSRVTDVVEAIQGVVSSIENNCEAQVVICQIEPRTYIVQGGREPRVSQETYDKVARGINNKLNRVFKGYRSISFTSRPFQEALARDGVYSNQHRREVVLEKMVNCIWHNYSNKAIKQALGGH